MIQETFAIGNSLFHRLDPRLKLIAAAVLTIMIALADKFSTLIAAFIISCLFIIIANLNVLTVIKKLLAVNIFVLFFWIVVPLTYPGDPLWLFGPFTITEDGVSLCLKITLKSNAILLCLISLTATSTIAVIGHALHRLYLPRKMVHLLLLTYRYISVIELEFQRLLTAVKIRSFHPKTSLHTYKTYAYLIGMLFIRASERAENVHQAMICRGFKGKFYALDEFSFAPIDFIWTIIITGVIICLEILEWNII